MGGLADSSTRQTLGPDDRTTEDGSGIYTQRTDSVHTPRVLCCPRAIRFVRGFPIQRHIEIQREYRINDLVLSEFYFRLDIHRLDITPSLIRSHEEWESEGKMVEMW